MKKLTVIQTKQLIQKTIIDADKLLEGLEEARSLYPELQWPANELANILYRFVETLKEVAHTAADNADT